MQYHLAPLFCRPWTLIGITPRLIESHYEGNYGSACAASTPSPPSSNALDPATTSAEDDRAAEARRGRWRSTRPCCTSCTSRAWAATAGPIPDAMATALARDFGSVDRWRREFIALAEGAGRRLGLGAADLRCRATGRLINQSRRATTAKPSPAASRSWPSTCTSTPITSTSAPTRRPMSPPSCATSTGRRPGPLRRRDQGGAAPGRASRRSSPTCRR